MATGRGRWSWTPDNEALVHGGSQYEVEWSRVSSERAADEVVQQLAEKTWVTKEDLVHLMMEIRDRVRRRTIEQEERRQNVQGPRDDIDSVLGYLAGEMGAQGAPRRAHWGDEFGRWKVVADESRGQCVLFADGRRTYHVELHQLREQSDVARLSRHLVFKDFLSQEEVRDGIQALVAAYWGIKSNQLKVDPPKPADF